MLSSLVEGALVEKRLLTGVRAPWSELSFNGRLVYD
jgi:hypothetical protein